MIKIGRAIEGAKEFLKENGFDSFTDEELEDSFFYEKIEN